MMQNPSVDMQVAHENGINYKRVENQYFHHSRSIVFYVFLMSKMHGYTFIEDSVPCRKAFGHDLGMTSWIQRLQW